MEKRGPCHTRLPRGSSHWHAARPVSSNRGFGVLGKLPSRLQSPRRQAFLGYQRSRTALGWLILWGTIWLSLDSGFTKQLPLLPTRAQLG